MKSGNGTRRAFLHTVGQVVAATVFVPAAVVFAPRRGSAAGIRIHPEPRPGVDGGAVLPADRVLPHVADLFDAVRKIPAVVDGIGCYCGCAPLPEMYSLLSCYEGVGMAQYCAICEGSGRLAVRLHAGGSTLDEIRAAIDRRFG